MQFQLSLCKNPLGLHTGHSCDTPGPCGGTPRSHTIFQCSSGGQRQGLPATFFLNCFYILNCQTIFLIKYEHHKGRKSKYLTTSLTRGKRLVSPCWHQAVEQRSGTRSKTQRTLSYVEFETHPGHTEKLLLG